MIIGIPGAAWHMVRVDLTGGTGRRTFVSAVEHVRVVERKSFSPPEVEIIVEPVRVPCLDGTQRYLVSDPPC